MCKFYEAVFMCRRPGDPLLSRPQWWHRWLVAMEYCEDTEEGMDASLLDSQYPTFANEPLEFGLDHDSSMLDSEQYQDKSETQQVDTLLPPSSAWVINPGPRSSPCLLISKDEHTSRSTKHRRLLAIPCPCCLVHHKAAHLYRGNNRAWRQFYRGISQDSAHTMRMSVSDLMRPAKNLLRQYLKELWEAESMDGFDFTVPIVYERSMRREDKHGLAELGRLVATDNDEEAWKSSLDYPPLPRLQTPIMQPEQTWLDDHTRPLLPLQPFTRS